MKGDVKGKASLDISFHRTPKAPPSSSPHIHLKTAVMKKIDQALKSRCALTQIAPEQPIVDMRLTSRSGCGSLKIAVEQVL
jgi:hypothetical protein